MTDFACILRPALPQDAANIAAMIRELLPSRLLNLFIYGCHGIAEFLSEQIAVQAEGGDMCFVVAAQGARVIGCAEMRRFSTCLFLDYIAVCPEFRSQGLGKRLLRNAIETCGADDVGELALDVLDLNTAARRWYERLGFESRYSTSWLEASLDEGQPSPIRLLDYAQAQACQRAYGFSRFRVQTDGQEYDVGRLGADWYRVTDPQALAAPGLTAGLKRLSPQRKLLAIARTDDPISRRSNVCEVARFHRLVATLEVVRRHLHGADGE